MLAKLLLLFGLVSTGLLLLIMTTYEPSAVGAVGILAVFFLGYVTILCVLALSLWTLVRLVRRLKIKSKLFFWVRSLTLKEVYYYSSVFALAPVVLIGLKSVGNISLYEVVLVLLFEVLACIYVAKQTS